MRVSMTGWLRRRFQLLLWPLTLFETASVFREEAFPLRPGAKRTRYPFRVLRYWWVINAIGDEVRRLHRPVTIVDVGSEKGLLKNIVPPIANSRWIGLDRDVSNEYVLGAGYDELHACNLEDSIPLPDDSADVLVCLHIFEHLSKTETTLAELTRVVKPGGVLLIGTPVLPRLLAAVRQRQFRREIVAGKRTPGEHVLVFYPALWRRLIRRLGVKTEMFTGSHFLRMTGNSLENFQLWVRLNQFIAACVPSLGNELCIRLRMPPA